MKQRCLNPNNNCYDKYGGRGIKVCDRWLDFQNFLEDMGRAPKGFSIERKDVNGNYEPDNCIWADYETQANNKRGLKKYLVDDQWLTRAQIMRIWHVGKEKANLRLKSYKTMIVGESNE